MIIPNHALNKQTFHCLESVYGNLANWIRKSGYCMVAFSHLYWHIHSHLCLHQCVARPAFRAKMLPVSTKSINHDDIAQGHGLVAIHCTEWLQRRASLLYLSHLVTSCLLSSSKKTSPRTKFFSPNRFGIGIFFTESELLSKSFRAANFVSSASKEVNQSLWI